MVTSEDLARLKIRRIVFHDVPTNQKGGSKKATFSDALTEIDSKREGMLRERLTRALGSKSAYPVNFESGTTSPVPKIVRKITASEIKTGEFITESQSAAQHLFDKQIGTVSDGLLCVIDVASAGNSGVAILKLERERGAELEMKQLENGQRTFEMSVLDNLVLTDGTRLFKSALFLRVGKDAFRMSVCDSQAGAGTSTDVAQFWLRFLGCAFIEEPRVQTQKWFDATIEYLNDVVTDAVVKNDIYEHLMSELKSSRTTVSPKRFIENFMPEAHRGPYKKFLESSGIPLQQFVKDTSDIAAKLKRRAFHTSNGVTVTAPADKEDLVQIKATQIIVQDKLKSVSTK